MHPSCTQAEETRLPSASPKTARGLANSLLEERFDEAMAALARLRRRSTNFSTKSPLTPDEPELRENRLRLLARIRDTLNQVADFSQIEG